MGQPLSAIKENEENNVEGAKAKLQALEKLLRNKVEAATSKLEIRAKDDQHLPIAAVVDSSYKFSANYTTVVSKEVDDTIDDMFSGAYLTGLKHAVKMALNEFLGNISVGEQEAEKFTVVFSNNALLRVDYVLYRYQFESHGIKDESESGFCYITQVGVLDVQKVNRNVLLYELSKSLGSRDIKETTAILAEIAEFAKNLFDVLHLLSDCDNRKITWSGESHGMLRKLQEAKDHDKGDVLSDKDHDSSDESTGKDDDE